MRVEITKHTDLAAARRALATTMDKGFTSTATLDQIYTWMHSPMRTQIFEIFLEDVPTFVSVHLVRHVTTQPFVTSKRSDRGGDGAEDRYTPVDMRIWCNAESIIAMAGKRLCYKASKETRETVQDIQNAMAWVDADLAEHMVPNCVLQGGYCREPKTCGNYKVTKYDPRKILALLEK